MDELKKIFTHPMVEYIPLPFKIIKEGRREQGRQSRIYVVKDLKELVPLAGEIEVSYKKRVLFLLLLNAEIHLLKYRGYNVTMIGERREGYYQVSMLSCEYFYKDRLHFLLFSPLGERMAQKIITLHPW